MDASASPETEPPSRHFGAAGEHHELGFWRKYIFSIDHKVIGLQCGLTGLTFMLLAFCLMILMRSR